jgi:Alpha/beta hydrolase domain
MQNTVRVSSAAILLILGWVSAPLQARVTRIEVESRTDVLHGKSFGDAGSYERLSGQIYYSVRVDNPHNTRIVDLAHAVNLRRGEVEFSANFVAFRPKDPRKGNGSLLLEVPNRGRPHIIALVDGGDEELRGDVGDAWLLRKGYTIVSVGWQWDAPGPDDLRLDAPIAREGDRPISGLLRGDFMLAQEADGVPLGHLLRGRVGGTEYPVANPDDPRNVLTVRDSRDAKRTVIPRSQWQFADMADGKVVPSDRHIRLNGGFRAGKIYEYVYVVTDPVIAGLGFAAIRDFASYAKRAPNAVLRAMRVYGEGISQNGRFLRDFLYEGFNADEEGKSALDGVLAHVAGAGRGSFNYRFAQPSRDAEPTSSLFFPTDIFPFTDLPQTDPVTGERAGLLDRAVTDKVVPKIFFSNTSYEYWGRAAALIHMDADGKQDVPISDNVRIYHFTGLQHFSGPSPPRKGAGDLLGQQDESPLPIRFFWRAMIASMDAWVRSDTAPPRSSYPRIDNGTLVPLRDYGFPPIRDVNRPDEASDAERLDFGPRWQQGILSLQPPKVGKSFPVLVPQVDDDGNERDGVRLPEMVVPLGTYTGWNLRDPSIGAPEQRVSFEASYIPFARTRKERREAGDPRKSIEERYGSREDYLDRFSHALDDLIEQRWILPEDRDALMARGRQDWDDATR